MDNQVALDPKRSVVVEACAGSGKTWLLVSRIVRLLLDEINPGEILAITFTRKAAQEMQARLHDWLQLLAVEDDDTVRRFLHERALVEVDDILLAKARGLYHATLLAQPGITINTFHGWFMQIIQRAPLNSGVPVGMRLLEQIRSLQDEAWLAFSDSLRKNPEGETSRAMQWLFAKYGLFNTRKLMENFVQKRAEWWAYTQGQRDALAWAIEQLKIEFGVDDPEFDPLADWGICGNSEEVLFAFLHQLAGGGTDTQNKLASKLEQAWTNTAEEERFVTVWPLLFTKDGDPRKIKPTKNQDEARFSVALKNLLASMIEAHNELLEIDAFRMNRAALQCGTILLEHFQELKQRQQQMDFTDLEWQVCHMLNQADCAEYMQYKLDSRYRHVLLDEFQDTNPLQWQILQSWFAASASIDSCPTVFIVGDPKQSIYRFRRADARLFDEVREFLQQEFGACYLTQNETRRNAPAILDVVNGMFMQHPDGFVDFEEHVAHHHDLPGYVEVLPILPVPSDQEKNGHLGSELKLRNPLTTSRDKEQNGSRDMEAEQFAARIANIVGSWTIKDEGKERRAEYRDIMVLVRKRLHLRVYEHALRTSHIPFLTSRRGGLLDTLEAEDIQSLLTFLITPFADLELAQVLRSPIFSCSDEDLMQLASVAEGRWWDRLQRISQSGASAELQRASHLIQDWLDLADKLPVHDLLDRIYFEGDLLHRYVAALPVELHDTVRANLHAFMQIALNVDAGRYPSLPRFLSELGELREAESESPDEGQVGEVGNALRIYTVHEAKGLEAPIVWLLDANDKQSRGDNYAVLLDWQPNAQRPGHFSLYSDKSERGIKRSYYFDSDEAYARREEMNLLYVAMTRAKQALLVSGNGDEAMTSWYGRIAQVAKQGNNPLQFSGDAGSFPAKETSVKVDAALQRPIPTGIRIPRHTKQQQRGIWLHHLLEKLTPPDPIEDKSILQTLCDIPSGEFESLWLQARKVLLSPNLARFFNPGMYKSACNEMPYINSRGEIKRIDRLVEFESEVWILDYKMGDVEAEASYRAQMMEYREAILSLYPGKLVHCALVFSEGVLNELSLELLL